MSSATLDRRAPGAPAGADAPPDPLRGTPPARTDVLVAVGVAVVVMVVAWVWRSPIVPTDPWHYVQRALTFPDRVWIPLGYTRYGIIVPNIVPARLFGNAEAAYYFWPMVSAGVLAGTTYLVGRRWWGPVAGLVAVVVLFANSLVFYNLTRQYPDVMSMAVILAALFCALMARDRDVRGRAGVLWLLAAGFFLGWSFEVRETALFAWPLVLFVLWRRGTGIVRTTVLAALPALLWAALDVFVSTVAYGDPLLKVKALLGFGASASQVLQEDTRTRLDYLLAIPTHALETRPDGVWMVATGAVALLAFLVPNRPLRLVSLSFVWVYALNLAAGGVLSPDKVVGDLFNTRYWIQYVPFVALVVGGLTGLLVAWVVRRAGTTALPARVAVATVAGLLAVTVPLLDAARTVPTVESFAANGGNALEELRGALAANPTEGTVWTDTRTRRLLPIFERPLFGGDDLWSAPVKRLADPAELRSGDLVVLYSAYDDTCFHCRIQIQPWLEDHPEAPKRWDLVWSTPSRNAELYRVR